MKAIKRKMKAIQDYDPEKVIMDAVRDNADDIASYVPEHQLYIEGVRGSDGASIMDYQPYRPLTVKLKNIKGQPTDRVTLRDTGAFHKSMQVRMSSDGFEVVAEDWKTEELKDKYGDGILALSDESVESVKHAFLIPNLIKSLKEALWQ